ncbi:MAG: hypothetical protein JO332_13870, partial [Planctomycetaceae bacterium]|nr:hypothetical protein [Planctomycetaceae bacterium]
LLRLSEKPGVPRNQALALQDYVNSREHCRLFFRSRMPLFYAYYRLYERLSR